jgi:hypothetical protein
MIESMNIVAGVFVMIGGIALVGIGVLLTLYGGGLIQ